MIQFEQTVIIISHKITIKKKSHFWNSLMIHQLGLCTFTAEDTTDSIPGQELRSCKPHKKRKGGTGAEESLKKKKTKKNKGQNL